jgi:hypothetical protein
MIKSAKAVDPAAEYVWKFSGSPIRIHVAISVISKLRQQLNSDTSVDPAQKKEIGGLLIGGIRDGRLAITDVEPLSLDPGQRHFILSDSQKEFLRKTIAARQASASTAIVGYYRSDVRTGIKLAEEDLVLIREFFRSPLDVFLVIRADDEGKPKAGFFFWDAGAIFSDASFLEFPLDETLVSLTKRAESQPQTPPVPAPAATKQTEEPVVRTSKSGALRKAFYAIPLILIVLAVVWAVRPYLHLIPQLGPQAETANSGPTPVVYSPLSLWAARAEKVVTITWDSKRPAMSGARVAVLTIKDNNAQRDISLTRNQLEANRFVYISTGDTVEISLEVFAESGKPTVESIMIAAPQPGQTDRSRSIADVVVRRGVAAGNSQSPLPATQAPPSLPRQAAAPPSQTPRTFIANTTPRQVIVQPNLLSDAPSATSTTALNPPALKAPEYLASSPLQPLVQPPVQPPPRATLGLPAVAPAPVQPAKPLRQVTPVVPTNVVSLLRRPIDIRVRVSIDEKGRVVRAEPLVPPGGINQYLAAAAASTARMWTFQPARRGDTPLSSEMVLNFTFTPRQ